MKELDPTIVASIYGGIFTILSSVSILMLGRLFEKSKESETIRLNKRIEVYQDLIAEIILIMSKSDKNRNNIKKQVDDFIYKWTPKAMVWASENIIIKWIDLRMNTFRRTPDEILKNTENLIYEIRSEIGLPVNKIKKHGLMNMLVVQNKK